MTNLDFIYNRQSIRKFKDEPIPKEDIMELLKAATFAQQSISKIGIL